MIEEKASISLENFLISFLAAPRSRESRRIDLANLSAVCAAPAMATRLAARPTTSAMANIIQRRNECSVTGEAVYFNFSVQQKLHSPSFLKLLDFGEVTIDLTRL